MTGPKKGSRGRAPKRNVAQGRGGATRENTTPVRERTTARGSEISSAGSGKSTGTGRAGSARPGASRFGAKSSFSKAGSSKTGSARGGTQGRSSQTETRSDSGRPDSGKPGSGSGRTDIVKVGAARSDAAKAGKAKAGGAKTGARPSKLGSTKTGTKSGWVRPTGSKAGGAKPGGSRGAASSRDPEARSGEERSDERAPAGRTGGQRSEGGRSFSQGGFSKAAGRRPAPRINGKKALPELKRVQLDAPDPSKTFKDRDGELLSFPDSNLKRVAAQILTEKNKAWRYRPFAFPLFTERGGEQSFYFDFYVYDAEDSVIRLLLVVPFESREVWDKVGRFKRQYPMYTYELWTPEKLARLMGPRGNLGF